MDREQKSLLFPGAGGWGPLCGFVACLDWAVTGCDVALSAQGLHSASIPGILALDLCPSDTNKILTGESRPGPVAQAGREAGKVHAPVPCVGPGTKVPSSAEGPGWV